MCSRCRCQAALQCTSSCIGIDTAQAATLATSVESHLEQATHHNVGRAACIAEHQNISWTSAYPVKSVDYSQLREGSFQVRCTNLKLTSGAF